MSVFCCIVSHENNYLGFHYEKKKKLGKDTGLAFPKGSDCFQEKRNLLRKPRLCSINTLPPLTLAVTLLIPNVIDSMVLPLLRCLLKSPQGNETETFATRHNHEAWSWAVRLEGINLFLEKKLRPEFIERLLCAGLGLCHTRRPHRMSTIQ